MRNKRGISLIVLIITIVVIIILATAIIVNLAQTNIINNANEAVVKQDFKTLQDELTLYIADRYVEEKTNFDITTLDADKTTTPSVYEILTSLEKTKYEDYVTIVDGEIVIADTMPEPKKTWAIEAIKATKTSDNTPIEPTEPEKPEETVTPVVAVNTIVTTANSTITGGDFEYSNPVIPVGFKAIETTDATWADTDNDGTPDGWNNGLVIQDKDENEFVWVPCTMDTNDTTNIQYTRRLDEYPKNSEITSTSDDTNALPTVNGTTIDENTQITKYSGFYIGRYEASVPANQTTIDGASSTTSDTTGTPVVKQGATVWTNISYTNANTNALSLCTTDNVKSGLITGTAWDTVCAWINSETDLEENTIHSVTDSRTWGNYSDTTGDAQYDTDGTTEIYKTKRTAGYSGYWKAKNIYDLAGNTWEWTGEIYSSSCIYRGGCYDNYGSDCPISYRNYRTFSHTGGGVSFRVMLYVM